MLGSLAAGLGTRQRPMVPLATICVYSAVRNRAQHFRETALQPSGLLLLSDVKGGPVWYGSPANNGLDEIGADTSRVLDDIFCNHLLSADGLGFRRVDVPGVN